MKHRLLLLLLPAFAAAADFELTAGDEWEALKPDGDHTRAHYATEFADSDPKAVAHVRVMTYPLSDALAAKGLDAIARDWAPIVEAEFKEPRTVQEGASKLGDKDAWSRDVRTDAARLTWHLARAGKVLFVFHVIRTNRASDDKDLEEEIGAMRAKFRFLVKEEPPGEARPPKPPPVTEPKEEPRATLAFDVWRFECVKPLGLVQVPPENFDTAERESGVVARFERRADQTLLMVRIYAQMKGAQRFTIDQLAEQKLKRFEETYDKAHRKPPVRNDAVKFPMAEKAIRLDLAGRRKSVETVIWLLAQCKNDRQYQIEILYTGGDESRWAAEIREVLDGFRPLPE
ncbi:MAG: hypothetical protein ACHQ1G_08740 [Planctomycetota bacterium]